MYEDNMKNINENPRGMNYDFLMGHPAFLHFPLCRLNLASLSKGPTPSVGSILIKVITSSHSSLARHYAQEGGISQLWDYVHQSHIHQNIPLWVTITATKNISAHKTAITEIAW